MLHHPPYQTTAADSGAGKDTPLATTAGTTLQAGAGEASRSGGRLKQARQYIQTCRKTVAAIVAAALAAGYAGNVMRILRARRKLHAALAA